MYIFADRVGFKVSFLEISQCRHVRWSNNVQVTIFVTCLNFAGTGSRILLPVVSSCRRVIPSQKIALNQAPDSEPSLTPVFLSSTCFRPPGAAQQQSGFLNFTPGSVWKWRLQWRSSGSPMERSVAHGTLIDAPRYASAWKQRKRR